MIALFKSEKTSYKILTMAVLAAAIFFVCRICYAAYLSLPYSRELLEPANVALTNTFLDGKSPYTLSSLEWDVPGINYDYPFLNSLIAAAIAKVTTCSTVTAHLIISLASILISGYIGILMMKDHCKTTVAPALAMLMFMFCHWRFGYISASPDGLGLLLFLLTLHTVVNPKIKNKPVLCAVGITLCFYTKQYFVFVAVSVFLYMYLYSRKDALKLLVYSIVFNAVATFLVTRFWPLYWMRAFAFTYLGTVIGGGTKMVTFFEQMKYLISSFGALFVIIVVAAVLGIRRIRKSGKKLEITRIRENDAFALCMINLIIMLIPLVFLGRNDGAFISYFLQLWMPSVTVVALASLEKLKLRDHEYIFQAIYVMVSALTIYLGFGRLPQHILTPEEITNWEKAYEYTRSYSEKGDIFYSRSLAYDGFERKNGQWQCGHEGEVGIDTVYAIISTGFPIEAFPNMARVVDQNLNYRDQIVDKGKNHNYSLITFEPGTNEVLLDEEKCREFGYKLIDRIPLQLGNMQYEVVFYALE